MFRQNKKRSRRFGIASVEFALVAPVFVIMIAVCAEFGRMCMLRNMALNACYESCRVAMMEGATAQDGVDRAREILSRMGNVQAEILVNGSDGSENTVDFQTAQVTTTISINLAANSVIVPEALFKNATVRTQTTLNTERFAGFFDASAVQ